LYGLGAEAREKIGQNGKKSNKSNKPLNGLFSQK
jgi:hypothetical protein